MGNSLQDQLLKAGLIKQGEARNVRAGKRRQRKRTGNKRTEPNAEISLAAAEMARKRDADRERNRKIEEKRQRKALYQRFSKQVEAAQLNVDEAEIPYYFERRKRIKSIYVTAEQQGALNERKLAVVGVGPRHYLVPAELAIKIRSLTDNIFVHLEEGTTKEAPAEDEPYAAYAVPDDLRW